MLKTREQGKGSESSGGGEEGLRRRRLAAAAVAVAAAAAVAKTAAVVAAAAAAYRVPRVVKSFIIMIPFHQFLSGLLLVRFQDLFVERRCKSLSHNAWNQMFFQTECSP